MALTAGGSSELTDAKGLATGVLGGFVVPVVTGSGVFSLPILDFTRSCPVARLVRPHARARVILPKAHIRTRPHLPAQIARHTRPRARAVATNPVRSKPAQAFRSIRRYLTILFFANARTIARLVCPNARGYTIRIVPIYRYVRARTGKSHHVARLARPRARVLATYAVHALPRHAIAVDRTRNANVRLAYARAVARTIHALVARIEPHRNRTTHTARALPFRVRRACLARIDTRGIATSPIRAKPAETLRRERTQGPIAQFAVAHAVTCARLIADRSDRRVLQSAHLARARSLLACVVHPGTRRRHRAPDTPTRVK